MGIDESSQHPAEQQAPHEDLVQICPGSPAFHCQAEYMLKQCLSMQIYLNKNPCGTPSTGESKLLVQSAAAEARENGRR